MYYKGVKTLIKDSMQPSYNTIRSRLMDRRSRSKPASHLIMVLNRIGGNLRRKGQSLCATSDQAKSV